MCMLAFHDFISGTSQININIYLESFLLFKEMETLTEFKQE